MKLFSHLINNQTTNNNIKNGSIKFVCNICGKINIVHGNEIGREIPSCIKCGSNVRYRAIIYLLALTLFKKPSLLTQFPNDKNISGIGMSDCNIYANILKEKMNYLNTFYHKEPKLDITNINKEIEKRYKFVICSEILEHIQPPISIAFNNLFNLITDDGFVILTVPYCNDEGFNTIEHFPNLHNYEIKKKDNGKGYILKNYTLDGDVECFENLIFHGGEGSTLEMRVFSESDIIKNLKNAGFKNIVIWNKNFYDYGIMFNEMWSLPILASK